MVLYIENPKDTTRKLVELINQFGKVAGYKINAQKSLAFLYTNDEIPYLFLTPSLTHSLSLLLIVIHFLTSSLP